jgi:LuxR family maltose regulon positive regulatory protein
VLEGLDFLLRNTGPGLRVVICSRMDPLLPLYRYRLAGELAQIRAGDLAFTVAETGLLLARHGIPLPVDSLEYLTRRTEGWAAGIRLAALSMDGHPDPGQFVKALTTEDNALTSYLMDEVLGAQPPEVQEVLLCTSILEHVSPDCAGELTGNSRAAGILTDLAHTNAFVRPIGGGWYRYHTMVTEVLRLKLRHRSPDRIPGLHQRAALWYRRHGRLTDAVRHAVAANDWQFAATVVIDALAIGRIVGPGRGQSLAEEFAGMPQDTWDAPEPYLVSAAVALVDAGPEAAAVRLAAADRALEHAPADQQAAGRFAAALIRLAMARRTGDLAAAAEAAASAESLLNDVPYHDLASQHEIRAEVLARRGAVELWSGRFDEAARILKSGVAVATTAGGDHTRADCLGNLALAEALKGRLNRAEELADEAMAAFANCERRPPAQYPNPAALLAAAWVRVENDGLSEATDLLRQLDSVLTMSPDKLLGAMACLVAARSGLAEGRAAVVAQYLAKARSGWPVPPAWLEKRLSLVESRAAAAQDAARPLAAAQRGDPRPVPLGGSGRAPEPLIVEPLTEREQEVLRHVAHMLSTAEVAGAMYISTNTVKTHLKSIFRKLAAGHRGEAVRRARELELI